MNWSRKGMVLGAFVLGAAIFTTTAMADVIIGSGYYRLKETTKKTAATLVEEAQSFQGDVSVDLKIDGDTFAHTTGNMKYDMVNKRVESTGYTMVKGEKETNNYTYRDKDKRISKYDDDVYYVRTLSGDDENFERSFISDPFQEEMTQDAEKILDAFVGNLKDIVQVEESDGKTMYTANLTEAQVPALVNAVSSFALKYGILDNYRSSQYDIPLLKTDIYVQDASAKVVESRNGIIETAVGSGTIIGKDKNGVEHTYTLEIAGNISGVNATTVTEPDLTGQEVNYQKDEPKLNLKKYVGKYKNDIVDDSGDTLAKIGERSIEILSADDGRLTGKYAEAYKEGKGEATSFDFTGEIKDNSQIQITYTVGGEEKNGVFHLTGMSSQNLNVQLDVVFDDNGRGGYHSKARDNFDNDFVRVFD